MTTPTIISVTDLTFESEVLKASRPVLVMFGAPQLLSCKSMRPIIDEIAEELGTCITIATINIFAHRKLAEKFEVRNKPALLLFEKGNVIGKRSGLVQKDDITAMLHSLEDWRIGVEYWKWDGSAVSDIMLRIDVISNNFWGTLREWATTVPTDCRGSAYCVTSRNPYNSEQEIRDYFEIVAVDQRGEALVRRALVDTYTDAESDRYVVIAIDDARVMLQGFRNSPKEVQLEEEEADSLYAQWPSL